MWVSRVFRVAPMIVTKVNVGEMKDSQMPHSVFPSADGRTAEC
jgi:hypothetical protein